MAKLVEILARELKEWPEGAESIWQADDGAVLADTVALFAASEISDVDDYVTRAQWEAERARIAANQQATAEAREIARTGAMTAEEQELADIACGKRSREDQELWDKVAIGAIRAYMAQPKAIGDVVVEEFVGWGVEVADAFMAERAKRIKGGV